MTPVFGGGELLFGWVAAFFCMRGWYESVEATMVRSEKPGESMLGIGSE